MKMLLGKFKKQAGSKVASLRVLSVDLRDIPSFAGFSYTVAEGRQLARRSYTELPEFALATKYR